MKRDVTLDEEALLSAALFGETPTELANWTAMPLSKVRRMLKCLCRRGLMDTWEKSDYSWGRKYRVYKRVGPED